MNLPMQNAVSELLQAWQQRSQREQRMIAVGVLALLLTLFYLLVWEPITQGHAQAADALADARATAQRIERVAAMQPAQSRQRANPNASRSLLAQVNQAVRSNTLGSTPERLTPDGDDAVRVWLEGAPFNNLLRWLAELEGNPGLRLERADIDRKDGGMVDARLQVERAS
ncbi:type II secretion system protein M [Algiphilus sp. NNCM1]|uniref:type II secretion system protein GspM n=1 Tax=Algiphilus sp. TaxID=1872431 RepID=UPI001CA7AB80|nr:type II secretion system protein GspM [Algiphilus sp.]MBY8965282.1 type II secretion system protein M [Algiphilus acroporae]MCI5063444.1 type II secretion system protein M [Algiphilus sp.]MCI5103321.1 type II secretion system protein M [Algiphilus sp.]